MADLYAVPGETLTGIADAIRSKTGSDEMMTVAAMASAIEGISGGGEQAKTLEIEYDLQEDFTDTAATNLQTRTDQEIQDFFNGIVGRRGSLEAGKKHIFRVHMASDVPDENLIVRGYDILFAITATSATAISYVPGGVLTYKNASGVEATASFSNTYKIGFTLSLASSGLWNLILQARCSTISAYLFVFRAGHYKWTIQHLYSAEV